MDKRINANIYGILALLLGILSIAFGFVQCIGWVTPVLAVPGIILGILGIMKARKAGVRDIFSIIGIVLCVAGLAVFIYSSTELATDHRGLDHTPEVAP